MSKYCGNECMSCISNVKLKTFGILMLVLANIVPYLLFWDTLQ